MRGHSTVITSICGVWATVVAGGARAHIAAENAAPAAPGVWAFDLAGAVLLALLACIYAAGQWRLAKRARRGRGKTQAACFWAGWLALAVALGPPLDGLSARAFSAHMVQHEIMMLVAAPLLVLSRPLGTLVWGAPVPLASIARARPVRAVASLLAAPLAAWVLHAIVVWGWHVPAAFEAALRSEALHWLQHVSFFAAAVIFWWSILHPGRSGEGMGAALLSLLTTAIHTSALGVLLTFSGRVWYSSYAHHANPWALSTLEDQQLGGLIMWVPGGTVFVLAGLFVAGRWLARSGMETG